MTNFTLNEYDDDDDDDDEMILINDDVYCSLIIHVRFQSDHPMSGIFRNLFTWRGRAKRGPWRGRWADFRWRSGDEAPRSCKSTCTENDK